MNNAESGIIFCKHNDESVVDKIFRTVMLTMNNSVDFYTKLTLNDYREIVKDTQIKLNSQNYAAQIATQCEVAIKEYIKEDKFFIQTNLYLRASRPYVEKRTESIGWHRESFYGPNMQKSVNIWTPIFGVNEKNTLRVIPKSQLINDSEIVTKQISDGATKKGSTGNIIGFLYSPKIIVEGVDLTIDEPMNVPKNHSAIFPGSLIHGAAMNASEHIRFSVDFRILPFSAYNPEEAKQLHISSGKPYFELF